MELQLDGEVAVVVGAAQGLGFAIAAALDAGLPSRLLDHDLAHRAGGSGEEMPAPLPARID